MSDSALLYVVEHLLLQLGCGDGALRCLNIQVIVLPAFNRVPPRR
jgi:hypothetical protein